MKFKLLLSILMMLMIGLTSCVKDVDFNQIDDFDATPRYIASLVYFKIPAQGFLDSSNNEITTSITDETRLTVIEEEIFQKYLTDAVLDFEITNPFGRNIQVELQFLDEADNVTYQMLPIVIPAGSTKFTHQEIISVSGNPQFLNSRIVRASIQLITTTGSPIDSNDLEEFEFKSAGTFTFKF